MDESKKEINDFIPKQISLDALSYEQQNKNSKKKENGIGLKRVKKFFSAISLRSKRDKSPLLIKENEILNEMEMNNESNKKLHEILSHLVKEETVIEHILEHTSLHTKIKLAKSNFSLNDQEEYFIYIDKFIDSAKYLKDYLRKNEDNLVKYVEFIKYTEPKIEPKKTLFRKKTQYNLNVYVNELNFIIQDHLKVIDDFKLLITTRPSNFVDTFLNKNGLDFLLELLSALKYEWRYHPVHFNLIHCIRGILNSNSGCKAILNHDTALNILVQSIYVSDIKLKIKVIEIISPLCLWKIGRDRVLGAFTHFKEYARESFRFQYIVNLLAFQNGCDESLNEKLKVSIISLINLVIGEKKVDKENLLEDLDERLSLRMEFIKLGLQDVVNDLIKSKPGLALERHLDYYEYSRITDESCYLEISKDLDDYSNNNQESKVQYNNSKFYFDKIESKVKLTTMNLNWMNILENLVLMVTSKDSKKLPQLWYTIDKVVSEVVFGEKKIDEFDQILAKATENIELVDEIKELNACLERSTEEVKNLMKQNEDLNREIIDLKESLAKEIELKNSQKMDLEMKENMNKRVLSSSTPKQSPKKLNVFKEIDNSLNDSDLNLLTPNTTNSFFQNDALICPSPVRSAPIPIPPPPPVGPPPPPPPPALVITPKLKKKVPKSYSVMKPVHINKLNNNSNNTIWESVDEGKYYSVIDLKKIEEAFSVSLDEPVNLNTHKSSSLLYVSNNEQQMESMYSLPMTPKTIFTDPMRAISVNVATRKLPSSDELVNIIESMDPEQRLSETEISNLLQLVLTNEEKINLYSCNLAQMDELHNCLFKISKIMYYTEKLEIIRFKNSLKDQMMNQLSNVKMCCSLLQENKNILKLFELILCVVNYVNQNNQNGNAFGFKLSFLNKLSEIKTNERGLTLLHYLIMIIKDYHPELINIPEELEVVKKVAIFNITDLSNDITNLDTKMKKMNDLMDRIKSDPLNFDKNRKFFESMSFFYEENKKKIELTRNDYNDAIKKYTDVSKYFGESGSPTGFNDFFVLWSTFIKSFASVRDELEKKSLKESKTKFATISNKENRRFTITKRTVQRNEQDLNTLLNSYGNDSDFARFSSEIQTGEIYFKNRLIRKDARNRTKSYNLSKGATNRSRSPSLR
ncbi:unnamed protein product [Brachionus calyciflorus]|uniref:Uncharacterized protein n=1 Tax=Brachionus calyciflorus TaxID=104777 RepID=A0A814DQK7_9BILA|nr:unnamed protein product [Brachionus calyciflorus]